MKDGVCPKCLATTIIPNVNIADRGHGISEHGLEVKLHENPDALMFRGSRYSKLRAWICGMCGYTELYVDDPGKMYTAYRKAQQQQR